MAIVVAYGGERVNALYKQYWLLWEVSHRSRWSESTLLSNMFRRTLLIFCFAESKQRLTLILFI